MTTIYDAANIAIECEQALEEQGGYEIGGVRTNANQSHAELPISYDDVSYLLIVQRLP